MGTQRRGFTLVELLVVVGIIAVLISILMPALARVRRQMRVTQCLSNQRQLIMAATMYAGDNGGALPIPGQPANTSSTITGWDPLLCIYMSDMLFSEVLVKSNPVGFGRLHAAGYLNDPRVAYESDHQNPQANFETYHHPGGWAAASGDLVRAGYYCNPHAIVSLQHPLIDPGINAAINTSSGLTYFSQCGKLAKPPFDVLTMDRPSIGDARRGHGYVWNIGYLDGSVRSYTSDAAKESISHYNGNTATTINQTAVWKNWSLHEQFLRLLTN